MFDQIQNAIAQVRSAWRFRWKALGVAWAIALAGWAVVFLIPSQYESSARVFVDTNTLLRPLLEGIAVSANTANQTDLVRRVLLGRPQLERVIANTDLRLRVHDERDHETLLRDLMNDIRITGQAATPQTREANIFNIAYMDSDRHLAYTVVRTLLDSFVQQSVGANRADADTAQRFLRDQIEKYERRLTDSEARLAEFKKINIGSMPDERGGYFERLQAEMVALDQMQASLTVAVHKRNELRARLLGEPAGSNTGTSTTRPAVLETSVDTRIKEATARLEEMLLRFTDQHPDVIALRETIVRLDEQRAQEQQMLRQNQTTLGSPRATTSLVVQNLQVALNQTDVEVATLQVQIADRQKRVAALRQRINTLPEVEAELLRLNRDYDVTKTEYERLLQRLERAELSDAADRVDEVRFKVIDPPIEPVLPAKPKRVLLLLAVLVAAFGGAGGFAWLMSQLRPVFVNVTDLARFKDVEVFGFVALAPDDQARIAVRFSLLAFAAAGVCLLIGGALLILFHPVIESISRQLMERMAA